MALVFRLLPFLVGILMAGCFWMQSRYAEWYPWILVPGFVIFLVSVATILHRRKKGFADAPLIIPSLIAILAAGFGSLLLEGVLRAWVVAVFAGLVAYLITELLFLSTFFAARYPVNGMTHMNLVLVPVIYWLVAYTCSGLLVFVNASRSLPIILFGVIGGMLWYVTAHPEATAESRRRWMLIGTWIGLQIGILIAVVPVRMEVHAAIAALAGAAALRVRRYSITPPIPKQMVFIEVLGLVLLLVAVTVTASWR